MHDTKIEMKLEEETKKLSKICEQLQEAIHHEFDKGIEHINVEEMGASIDMLKDIYEAKEKLIKGCYYKYILGAMEKEEEEEKEERKMMEKMREQYNEEDEDEERRFYRGQPRSRTSGRYMSRGDGRRSNRGRSRGYEEPMYYGMMPEIYNPMEYMRDMDRMDGKMYYSGGGQSSGGSSGGQSGQSSGGSSSGVMSGNMGGSTRGYEEGYSDGNRRGYEEGYRQGSQSGKSNSNYDNARRGYSEGKQEHKGNTPEDNTENMRNLEKLLGVVGGDIRELKPGMSQQEKAMTAQKLETWARELKQA